MLHPSIPLLFWRADGWDLVVGEGEVGDVSIESEEFLVALLHAVVKSRLVDLLQHGFV